MDYTTVTEFVVAFMPHPNDAKAHVHLNNLHSDAMPCHERVCVDETTQNLLKTDADMMPVIRKTIADEMIAPHAAATPDPAVIAPLINAAAMFVVIGNSHRRLGSSSLTRALDHAVNNHKDTVEIQVSISHVHFDTSAGPLNFLDWSLMSTTATPVAAPQAALLATDIATAVASAIPKPPSATDLATAFASAHSATTATASPATVGSAPVSSTTTQGSMFLFNSKVLPSDVQTRHDKEIRKGLVVGSTVHTQCAGGNFYHLEGTDKLVLADGTLFLIQTPNEKGLMKASISCEDDAHAGICAWHANFSQACQDCGFCVHPLWCFRLDHGGARGFSIGDDPDDDLPKRMEVATSKMSNPIFRLLSKRDMFPKNSRLASIANTCEGDGHRALKAVLFKSHPAFYDQPSTLISACPKQRESSMLQHYQLFLDYEQLRAYISNVSSRDERRLTSLQHKCRGSQLVETLEKFLMSPDSPALKETIAARSADKKKPFSRPFRHPGPVAVNQLEAVSEDDDSDNGSVSTAEDDDSLDASLLSVSVPKDSESKEIFHVYCAAVHRINTDPKAALCLAHRVSPQEFVTTQLRLTSLNLAPSVTTTLTAMLTRIFNAAAIRFGIAPPLFLEVQTSH